MNYENRPSRLPLLLLTAVSLVIAAQLLHGYCINNYSDHDVQAYLRTNTGYPVRFNKNIPAFTLKVCCPWDSLGCTTKCVGKHCRQQPRPFRLTPVTLEFQMCKEKREGDSDIMHVETCGACSMDIVPTTVSRNGKTHNASQILIYAPVNEASEQYEVYSAMPNSHGQTWSCDDQPLVDDNLLPTPANAEETASKVNVLVSAFIQVIEAGETVPPEEPATPKPPGHIDPWDIPEPPFRE